MRGRPRRSPGELELFTHIDFPVALIDPPTRDRVERRRTQRLPAAQAEAGVVPRAADGIADKDPIGERTVIMGTLRADGEQRAAVAREQHRFTRDLPQDHVALSEVRNRDPLGKVRSREFCILVAHDCLLLPPKAPL